MTKKAFIFDLDGVIVDTARYHFFAWQKIASELGVEFSPEHNEKLKGVSRIRSLEIILALGGINACEEDRQRWLHQKNEDYLGYIANMNEQEILPGVMHTLRFLRRNNQPIALGSASKNARPILEKCGILDFFDAIVDGNDVTNAKPDPEVFLQAARKLGASESGSVVFEDSEAGVRAANIAGMISVGIGDVRVLNEAHYCFPDFTHVDSAFLKTLIHHKITL